MAAIGRMPIGGKCSYLIRNSWGAMVRPSGAVDCACKVRDAKGALEYRSSCPRGTPNVIEVVGCWYAADDLIPNLTGVARF